MMYQQHASLEGHCVVVACPN